MSENEVDQIARETAMMGRSALAAIHQWRMQNPGKTRIPRGVQKKALRLWRNEMAAHQVRMAHNRKVLRAEIAGRVEWHRQCALDTWARSGGYPSEQQQEQLTKARQEIERTIARAPEFTATERGQAISALVSAHYATDPRKPAPPVWGGPLAGISALRARLADRLSRQQLGIAVPGRHGLGRPTTPTAGLHSYWTQPRPAPSFQAPQSPQQPGVSAADIERIEARQRQLAEQIALANRAIAERDQLQAKVQDLGTRYVDSQQLNRKIADDLASRGRELSDVHTELDRVRAERDDLRRKLAGISERKEEAASKNRARIPETPNAGTGESVPEWQRRTNGMGWADRRGVEARMYGNVDAELRRKLAEETSAKNRKNTPGAPDVPEPPKEAQRGNGGADADKRAKTPPTPGVPVAAAAGVNGRSPQMAAAPDLPEPPAEPTVPDWEWEGFDR